MQRKTIKPILISMGIAGAVIAAALLIFLPQFWPAYSCKPLCSSAESDANQIASMIADYFSIPDHKFVTAADLDRWIQSENPWTINQCGNVIYIYVYDFNEDCPVEYQNSDPAWNSSIYTKKME